jgi:hypothetical protein
VTYNIDLIRAIPFTMALAQMREFTNAYYGTGYGFERGSAILGNPSQTAIALLGAYLSLTDEEGLKSLKTGLASQSSEQMKFLTALVRNTYKDQVATPDGIESLLAKAKESTHPELDDILPFYSTKQAGIEEIALLCLDLSRRGKTPLELLQIMYQTFVPFRYSVQNKETALIIRSKRVVDEYTREATPEERALLAQTEAEGKLTERWLLDIMDQDQLEAKTMTQDFHSPELLLLHKIQGRLMDQHRKLTSEMKAEHNSQQQKAYQQQIQKLNIYIQMSILAISEALGFGG